MIIQIHKLDNFTDEEAVRIKLALYALGPVLSSDILRKKVLMSTFTETRGFTNEGLLNTLLSGKDGKDKEADYDVDIEITGYRKKSRTIGYTYLNHYKSWLNKYHLSRMSPQRICGHVMHELFHRLGWSHKGKHSTSVPYRMGKLIQEAYVEYYMTNVPTESSTLFRFAS